MNAIIFDRDGTQVQSEKLKIQSHGIAAQRMRGLPETEFRAIEACREMVDSACEGETRHVMESLDL